MNFINIDLASQEMFNYFYNDRFSKSLPQMGKFILTNPDIYSNLRNNTIKSFHPIFEKGFMLMRDHDEYFDDNMTDLFNLFYPIVVGKFECTFISSDLNYIDDEAREIFENLLRKYFYQLI